MAEDDEVKAVLHMDRDKPLSDFEQRRKKALSDLEQSTKRFDETMERLAEIMEICLRNQWTSDTPDINGKLYTLLESSDFAESERPDTVRFVLESLKELEGKESSADWIFDETQAP